MTLPVGWEASRLGDVVDFVMGQAPPGADCNQSGKGTPFVKAGEFGDTRPIIREWTTKPLKMATADDVLICVVGATAGKLNLGADCAIGRSVAAIRPTEATSADFIFPRLKSEVMRLRSSSTGTAQGVISREMLSAIELALPPVAEQRRIVAKLAALTIRLARARAELDRVPVLTDKMRDQALHAAFEGTLIDGGTGAWTTVPFSEAGEIASNLVDPGTIGDMPHIAPNHITTARPVLLPYTTIREDGVTSGKHRFFAGQILYSKIRPYLRKVVQVDFDGGCSADMYPINPRCHPRYLLYWMLSPQFTWLATRHEGRTVLPKINQNALNGILTPLAPTAMQIKIAEVLDVIFARADRLEAEAARARALLDRLAAAILAKAFQGELVPQDPADEPASVLLERIRAERAASPIPKRGRRARANSSAVGA